MTKPEMTPQRSRVHALLAKWLDEACLKWDGSETTHLHDHLGLDSLDSTDLMLFFEEELSINVRAEDERRFEGYVSDLLDLLERSA